MTPECGYHRTSNLGYVGAHADAEDRMKRGQKQRRCPACSRWYWHDQWGLAPKGLGWTAGHEQEAP